MLVSKDTQIILLYDTQFRAHSSREVRAMAFEIWICKLQWRVKQKLNDKLKYFVYLIKSQFEELLF